MSRTALTVQLLASSLMAALIGCAPIPVRDYPAAHAPGSEHAAISGSKLCDPDCVDCAVEGEVARELQMVSWPQYRIAPPDTLFITAVRVVPKAPYTLQPLDIIFIAAAGVFQGEEIRGPYQIGVDGAVLLGGSYGAVQIAGLTPLQAQAEIERRLSLTVRDPRVTIALFEVAGAQQIDGEHLVGMDGTITLGKYGQVKVAGMTIPEAKAAIEKKLGEKLLNPEVAVEVNSFASTFYYVVLQGGGIGDQVIPFPATGRETVLDAMAAMGTLPRISSKNIWIARPAPDGSYRQILPVAWNDVYREGITDTNYQVFPNDRIYVASDRFIAVDAFIARVTAPIERIFGFTLLGVQSVQTVNRLPSGFRSGQFGF